MFFSKPGDQNQAVSGTKHIFFGRPEYQNQAQSTILTTTIRRKVRFGAKPEWRRPHLGTNLLLRVGSGNHNQALSTFLATAIRRPGPRPRLRHRSRPRPRLRGRGKPGTLVRRLQPGFTSARKRLRTGACDRTPADHAATDLRTGACDRAPADHPGHWSDACSRGSG